MASIPSAEVKAQIWQELIDPTSTESFKQRKAKMSGFHSWRQLELTRPYQKLFYSALRNIHQTMPLKYTRAFFDTMLPRMEIDDSHVVELLKLKMDTSDSD